MKTKSLALAALIGAPFMGIGVYVEAYNLPLNQPWWTDFWGMMYMTGWLAGMEVMRRLALTGHDRFGRAIIPVVMSTLVLGLTSNIWHLLAPSYQPAFYWALDTCWPLSHVLMLGVGVAVLRVGKLTGLQAWLPVAMGLWFPITLLVSKTPVVLHLSNSYSMIVWIAMAVTLLMKVRSENSVEELEYA